MGALNAPVERCVTYSIAVRSLCEFTAKAGDLDLRFTPAPSAREGIEGHAVLARRRGPGYEAEIALESDYGELRVRGRADGYDAAANRLEEFKTHRGAVQRIPESHRALHWAQLRIYGALLCRARALKEIQLALVYFDIASEAETVCVEIHDAQQLERLFADHCERFLHWARRELQHRATRDEALRTLSFPFDTFHPRQRELAEAVYKSARRGRFLLAQAPTGIGKTIATLFPVLKAAPATQLDKVFFLVAKTSGRRVVLEAVARLQAGGEVVSLRVLELVARDKACEYPDAECHGDSCPLARGFYDRLPEARSEAASVAIQDRTAVREIARKHRVCPYYLSQELVRWADVVVGDYNYYFDQSALLYGLTVANQWRVAVLVDEAHNLLERGRAMFSARLDRAMLDAARGKAPKPIQRSLARVIRDWDDFVEGHEGARPYRVFDAAPAQLVRSLEGAVASIADFCVESPLGVATELLDFYFRALQLCRFAAQLDRSTICDFECERQSLSLRNAIPAGFLAPRWAAAHCSALFSATLTPFDFYRDVLGLPQQCERIEVGSPFAPEQLSVRIVSSISTRFRNRERSIQPLADLIVRQFEAQPGNYLAFLSSFDYLEAVACELETRGCGIPIWRQSAAMSEAQREQFLARFDAGSCGVGFAVLGGAFAEGVDLPGKRLIGAFVATLGLPQLNPVNGEILHRLQERFGAGYEYTYLYPGLRKVVQAAGRVIRGSDDRGVVYLIDDRFAQAEVRRLLPRWWRLC
jgi:DNA excision repair protein ERCC-2